MSITAQMKVTAATKACTKVYALLTHENLKCTCKLKEATVSYIYQHEDTCDVRKVYKYWYETYLDDMDEYSEDFDKE